MKITIKLILILAKCSVLLAAFSKMAEMPIGRIFGGHEASPHSHPYVVSLQTQFLWIHVPLCGGALLNTNWILTAGHCIQHTWLANLIYKFLPLDAVAGIHNSYKFDHGSQVATIEKKIVHPDFNLETALNDIAMLKTKRPFTFTNQVQPIHLPLPNYKITSEPLILAGWGLVNETKSLPWKLQEVQLTHLSFSECERAMEIMYSISVENLKFPLNRRKHVCSGPITGGISACIGDSGSPLIQYTSMKIEDDNDDNNVARRYYPVAVGIVSWSMYPCGSVGSPTVYTKVANYIDFIKQSMNT